MARTKQTARKSTGGKAPRMQLAARSSKAFRSFVTSQQKVGNVEADEERKAPIFINCENTMGSFSFERPTVTQDFLPIVRLGRVSHFMKQGDPSDNLYLRLDFASKFDGPGMATHGRSPVDLVIVLDISGSMGANFPDDSDARTKLTVAKTCIRRLLEELNDNDRVALVYFNHTQTLAVGLRNCDAAARAAIDTSLNRTGPDGGTSLAEGFSFGLSHCRNKSGSEPARTRRVMFMTDMESTPHDEEGVLSAAASFAVDHSIPSPGSSSSSTCLSALQESKEAKAAPTPMYEVVAPPTSQAEGNSKRKKSVVGEMLDSAVNQVRQLVTTRRSSRLAAATSASTSSASSSSSSTPSLSAASPKSGTKRKGTPKEKGGAKAAKDALPPVYTTLVGMGVDLSVSTVERLSSIAGAKYVSVIDAQEFMSKVGLEFAYDIMPIAFDIDLKLEQGMTFSRAYGSAELNSLKPGSSKAHISSEFPTPLDPETNTTTGGLYLFKVEAGDPTSQPTLNVQWTDHEHRRHEHRVSLWVPPPLPSEDVLPSGGPVLPASRPAVDPGLRKAVALTHYVGCLNDYAIADDVPSSTSANNDDVLFHVLGEKQAEELVRIESLTDYGLALDIIPEDLRRHHRFAHQFLALQDYLLTEMAACGDKSLAEDNQNILQTVSQIAELETSALRSSLHALKKRAKPDLLPAEEKYVPMGFKCPISLTLMTDPVIAADGHSYERKEIEKWLAANSTSPLTNLELPHKLLVSNHALKSSIEEFVSHGLQIQQEATPAAPAPASVPFRSFMQSPRKRK